MMEREKKERGGLIEEKVGKHPNLWESQMGRWRKEEREGTEESERKERLGGSEAIGTHLHINAEMKIRDGVLSARGGGSWRV